MKIEIAIPRGWTALPHGTTLRRGDYWTVKTSRGGDKWWPCYSRDRVENLVGHPVPRSKAYLYIRSKASIIASAKKAGDEFVDFFLGLHDVMGQRRVKKKV